jgi:hypothetical protein
MNYEKYLTTIRKGLAVAAVTMGLAAGCLCTGQESTPLLTKATVAPLVGGLTFMGTTRLPSAPMATSLSVGVVFVVKS